MAEEGACENEMILPDIENIVEYKFKCGDQSKFVPSPEYISTFEEENQEYKFEGCEDQSKLVPSPEYVSTFEEENQNPMTVKFENMIDGLPILGRTLIIKQDRLAVPVIVQNQIRDVTSPLICVVTEEASIRRYVCQLCQSVFPCQADLQQHATTSQDFYTCKLCQQSYCSFTLLLGHMLSHNQSMAVPCRHCNMRFMDEPSFDDHVRTHASPKAYQCPMPHCGRSFPERLPLVEHMREHNLVPYWCSNCDLVFTDKTELNQHKQMHSSEKTYLCSECPNTFTNHRSYILHQATHSTSDGFVCHYCDAHFETHWELSHHLVVHAGDKPYFCTECHRTFASHRLFELHKTLSSKKTNHKKKLKRFQCSYCYKLFQTEHRFRVHIYRHSNEMAVSQ